jgi:hypothetical protein
MDTQSSVQTQLLDSYQAASYLGLKNPGTLGNWRCAQRGPAYVKVGSRILYRLEDLVAWIERQRVEPVR